MGKVKDFRVQGLKAFFNSNDHYPPHFHVKKVHMWEIRVFLLTSTKEIGLHYEVKFINKKKKADITSRSKKEILDFVIQNKENLLADWAMQVCVKE